MTQPRPHRGPLPPEAAASELTTQVRAGRLDGDCVHAVLAAAGQHVPARQRRAYPGDLSQREVEVLCLLARGQSNRQIAAQLQISPKTAGHHVQHIYEKLGVSTRATAALLALEYGLLAE
jgi:DNA-binding NarL/FixJ family response regulator